MVFHGCSPAVAATEAAGFRPRPTEVPVPSESWSIESHGDLGILKRNHGMKTCIQKHPKVHPESRPGAPIGAQGVVGAIFWVPTRIY